MPGLKSGVQSTDFIRVLFPKQSATKVGTLYAGDLEHQAYSSRGHVFGETDAVIRTYGEAIVFTSSGMSDKLQFVEKVRQAKACRTPVPVKRGWQLLRRQLYFDSI